MSEQELIDAIAGATARSAKDGVLEVAGALVSLRRRVAALEGASKALTFDTTAGYRAWASNAKPRHRVRARSVPWP